MTACQKDKFSIPDDIAYLNCSYMSPLPREVEVAGIEGLANKRHPWKTFPDDFFTPVEDVKKLFAQLINAGDHQRIAILPSVSYGIANVVKNISPKPGQNIVMLEEQFPSNFYSWQRLADESGCTLRIIKAPDSLADRGEKWNGELLKNIDASTAAVSIPQAHWADGTLFDLEKIRRKTNEVGALLIIDGTQSVGALPFDVQKFQPDALICGSYKWLLGPYSFGLGYYSDKFDNGTPIEENWINRLDSEDFQKLVHYQPRYKPAAHRYCVGENSHFIAMPMMKKALELILEWKPENIQKYCKTISSNAIEELRNNGCWIENEQYRGHHLFGIRLPKNIDMESVKNNALKNNIFVSFRGNAIRVAPHLFNTKKDLGRLTELVQQ